MKKQIILFALMLSVTASAFAVEAEINGLWYEFIPKGNAAVVIKYKNSVKYSGDIVIPETVEYEGTSYRVTKICSYAFLRSKVTSVTIPNSVTEIEYKAFYECSSLISVTGNNIQYIGDEAFWDCSSLTTADILSGVIKIGSSAFYNCGSLTSVTIGNDIYRIGYGAFFNCSSLTSVFVGRGVKFIHPDAFANCIGLTDFYCSAASVPSTDARAFYGSMVKNVTLHVPEASINDYKAEEPWKGFKAVVALNGEIPEVPKCAKPTIRYANGKLTFDCETEDVKFVTEISDGDIKKHYDAEIQLTATYHISVYATKTDYDDSDVATATLCWMDVAPKTEGITNGLANVPAKAVFILTNGSTVTVQGADDGTRVSVYGINGVQAGSAISRNGQATVNTNLQPGSIAIVKIGEKSTRINVK